MYRSTLSVSFVELRTALNPASNLHGGSRSTSEKSTPNVDEWAFPLFPTNAAPSWTSEPRVSSVCANAGDEAARQQRVMAATRERVIEPPRAIVIRRIQFASAFRC